MTEAGCGAPVQCLPEHEHAVARAMAAVLGARLPAQGVWTGRESTWRQGTTALRCRPNTRYTEWSARVGSGLLLDAVAGSSNVPREWVAAGSRPRTVPGREHEARNSDLRIGGG